MKAIYLIIFLFSAELVLAQHGRFIDHRCVDLSQIPDGYITAAKQNLKIRYFRRSHGSQVDTGGMNAIRSYSAAYASKYAYSKTGGNGTLMLSVPSPWVSLDFENSTWVQITRDYLDDPANAQINVVMWAWSSHFYECDPHKYVNDMETLIAQYGPNGTKIISGVRTVPVTFVFQTACGSRSVDSNHKIYDGNWIIRYHCMQYNRILFDFNDIESWDPAGNYFGDGTPELTYTNIRMLNDDLAYKSSNPGGSVYPGYRNWGIDWMASNPNAELTKMAADNNCISCAHSQGTFEGEIKDNSRIHCVLKGKAAWWLWAILAGWQDGISSIENQNKFDAFQLKNYPNPFNGNTTIEYTLTTKSKVKLEILNSFGQTLKILTKGEQVAGNYKIPLSINGPKGIYFYSLEIDGLRTTKKMIKL